MGKQKNTLPFGPYIRWFWILFIVGVFGVVSIFISASLGLLGDMPDFRQLENPKTNLATQIMSADGKVLGKFYFNDNRTPILYKDLPQNMVRALIATEDERFYSHSGIDVRGTLRAVAYLGKKGGASTISQQLARQLFTGVRSSNKNRSHNPKNKRMGDFYSIRASLHQRGNHNDVP